ncbi:YbaK/EbsC family protein [uncultured Desulfovibrio sp.]|uniref:YbaK/EbsC family protein n=1 Tax=uncultured Desulfovibrio sp. TaxID=167968 RepID=UPI0032093F84
MRADAVKEQLAAAGLADRYREFAVSSATVELAAQALHCEAGRIAKSLSVLLREGPAVIVVMGTARLDNRKFKDRFRQKAAFIPGTELERLVGHPQGGVCPFALPEGVPVYLDESLRAFDPVYPAAGAPNNAVELHLDELEGLTGGQWVDVCKSPEPADA